MEKITVGSRESRLAVVQTEMVADYIRHNYPQYEVEILTMKTTGDKILDRKLDEIGGKGLFVRELDLALREKRCNLTVHSLKDLPMEVPEDLPIIGYSRREDPRDALILPEGSAGTDFSGPIGCSGGRRALQLKKLYPEAEIKSIRGNVLTRLKKLDAGEYGAIVLAVAGLKRLGLERRISRVFSPDEMIPAAGQGILCLQGRRGENYDYTDGFLDNAAADCAAAERAFTAYLNGGCSAPVAAYAEIIGDSLFLRGLYYDEDADRAVTGSVTGPRGHAAAVGRQLAAQLKSSDKDICGTVSYREGKVWLVGAGPGDFGLFTQKGDDVLSEAEVVVYDSLVGSEILSRMPADAKKIDAGKRAGHHKKSQGQTNEILLEEALKGNRVVRLKGGDPFLFGRGGEELELLAKFDVPYEVVPGVTSAVSVPAYNGIPVTHRDFASSVHIITGHRRAGAGYDINFRALVEAGGTYVFLMGLAALGDLMRGLLDGGISPDLPAAVLQQGTTARQKKVLATVSTIEEAAATAGLQAPAVIVVGEVCQLTRDISWFESLPLFGEKIVVTRPERNSSGLVKELKKLGAEVLCVPAIRTIPVSDADRLSAIDRVFQKLEDYTMIVFTSPYGVEGFFSLCREHGIDVRAFAGKKLAAIGRATAGELMSRGLFVDIIPDQYESARLGKKICQSCRAGENILIPRSSGGSKALVLEIQKAKNVTVLDLPIYDTVRGADAGDFLRQEMESVTLVTFTSASTVQGFVSMLPGYDWQTVTAVCIGKQTEAAAAACGMRTVTAKNASVEDMVACILSYHEEMSERGLR